MAKKSKKKNILNHPNEQRKTAKTYMHDTTSCNEKNGPNRVCTTFSLIYSCEIFNSIQFIDDEHESIKANVVKMYGMQVFVGREANFSFQSSFNE